MSSDDHRPAVWTGKRSVQAVETNADRARSAPAAEVDATDAAKAFASAYDLDLTQVKGTGSGGRITKEDVEEYLDASDPGASAPTADTA